MFPFRLFYATISTPNLERITNWYQEKLGFEVVFHHDFPEFGTRIAHLRLNDFRLEFIEQVSAVPKPIPQGEPPDHTNVHGITQICFLVEELDAIILELEGKGVEKTWEKRINPLININFQFFKDCDGNLLQFIELYSEAKEELTTSIKEFKDKFSFLAEKSTTFKEE